MSEVTTYQVMNEKIVGILECGDKPHEHYAAQRIRELEAEVAGLKSVMMEIGSDCDCLSCGGQKLHDKLCVVGKIEQAISTPTGSKLLDDLHELRRLLDCRAGKLLQQGKYFIVVSETEPYFSSVYDVIRLFERAKGTWNDEDEIIYQKKVSNIRNDEFSSESLKLLIKLKAENSKLLAKVEAGEKLAEAMSKIRFDLLAGMFDKAFPDDGNPEIQNDLRNARKALSAYSAACEGGGEGSNHE